MADFADELDDRFPQGVTKVHHVPTHQGWIGGVEDTSALQIVDEQIALGFPPLGVVGKFSIGLRAALFQTSGGTLHQNHQFSGVLVKVGIGGCRRHPGGSAASDEDQGQQGQEQQFHGGSFSIFVAVTSR